MPTSYVPYSGSLASHRNAAPAPFGTFPGSPLGRGGPGGLRDILGEYFLPELKRLQGTRGPIEEAFTSQATQPGALFGAAKTAAEGYARQIFSPGGEVASLIKQARGRSISSGFAPEDALGAENGILQQATANVGNVFSQQAAALEDTRFKSLGGAYSDQLQSIRDLLESIYTGVGTSEQLGLARQSTKKRFLGLF